MTAQDVEWERRFKARIVERLRKAPDRWTQQQAEEAAQAEFDGADIEYLRDGYEDDPEGSADEALSEWMDDGDE